MSGRRAGTAEESGGRPVPGLLELLRPRASRGQLAGALLGLLLGFAVVAQVRSTDADDTFATARQDELVGILSDLSQRAERLRGDIRDLEGTRGDLARDAEGEALEEARRRAVAYGILAGTLPAAGPGIELLIDDPGGRIRAGVLLDALQELRDAGAEVIQVGEVRVGVNTYFVDAEPGGGIEVDGRRLRSPYRFLVIGDPHTLTTALNIPGGAMRTIEGAGAEGSITRQQKITIRAVRSS